MIRYNVSQFLKKNAVEWDQNHLISKFIVQEILSVLTHHYCLILVNFYILSSFCLYAKLSV